MEKIDTFSTRFQLMLFFLSEMQTCVGLNM